MEKVLELFAYFFFKKKSVVRDLQLLNPIRISRYRSGGKAKREARRQK